MVIFFGPNVGTKNFTTMLSQHHLGLAVQVPPDLYHSAVRYWYCTFLYNLFLFIVLKDAAILSNLKSQEGFLQRNLCKMSFLFKVIVGEQSEFCFVL
jgi:hypothetical protein